MRPLDTAGTRRILVRGTNWVGDAVMSIPALKEIRRLFPQAHLTLLVRPWVRDVYAAADFVDELLEYDKRGSHRSWRSRARLVRRIRERNFDLAILLQNAFEAAWLTWLARVPKRLGYSVDGRGWLLTHRCRVDPSVRTVHQLYYYLGILSSAELLPPRLWADPAYKPPSIRVDIRKEDQSAACGILRAAGLTPGEPIIGINPGAAYGPAKRWLSERYAEVADRLARERGASIVIFGSPAEKRIADEVAARMKRPATVLAGQTTLGQLMGLIRECRLLVTNDSGPMHLAAALDVPQVAIFGSTSVRATGPLSASAHVVREPVECSPCFLRECPIDFRCMNRITVERVMEAAEDRLLV